MTEIEALIDHLRNVSFHDKADPPNSAVLILTQVEIGRILEALHHSQKAMVENLAQNSSPTQTNSPQQA
jgi:hypothetical protein